jgi:hypothetical protein
VTQALWTATALHRQPTKLSNDGKHCDHADDPNHAERGISRPEPPSREASEDESKN